MFVIFPGANLMKNSIAIKLWHYIPSWQLCLIISSITPMMLGINSASSQTITQSVISANIQRPNLRNGSRGESVSELQAALKLLGFYSGEVNGNYNQPTASAVSNFQRAAGLNPDGIVGNTTWQKLFPNQPVRVSTTPSTSRNIRVNTIKPEPRPANPPVNTASTPKKLVQKQTSSTQIQQTSVTTGNSTSQTTRIRQTSRTTGNSRSQTTRVRQTSRSNQVFGTSRNPSLQYTARGLPILRYGVKGSEVVTLQTRLKKLGFLEGDVDGDFQDQTLAAVKAFQKRYGLEDDGVVGGATWQILLPK